TGIHLAGVPAAGLAPAGKALFEPTFREVRVAEHKPETLRVRVRHAAVARIPDTIGNARGLIEDHEQTLALIMQALESDDIMFRPLNHVHAPGALMVGVTGIEGGGGELEKVFGDKEMEPLAELGPGLGFQLG